MRNDFDFEIWFDVFSSTLEKLGHEGRIDEDSAHESYDKGKSPEDAARELYNELNQNP